MKKHNEILAAFRQLLIADIATAVSQQNGNIGTIYKNVGVGYDVYLRDNPEPEIHRGSKPPCFTLHSTGNLKEHFERLVIYDIFKKDDSLFLTVAGNNGDRESPIIDIPVEGLLEIRSWLVENGFITPNVYDPLRCSICGSLDVLKNFDLNPNLSCVFDLEDRGYEDYHCNECNGECSPMRQTELVQTIQNWWDFHASQERLKFLGLNQEDFSHTPADIMEKTLNTAWNELTIDTKIEIWNDNTEEK